MSTATTSTDTGQQTSPRGHQREAQQPVTQQEQRNLLGVYYLPGKNTEGSKLFRNLLPSRLNHVG